MGKTFPPEAGQVCPEEGVSKFMSRNVTILIIILTVLVVAGYLLWLRSRLSSEEVMVAPTPTPTVVATPTLPPTPTAVASPSAIPKVSPTGKVTPSKTPTPTKTATPTPTGTP